MFRSSWPTSSLRVFPPSGTLFLRILKGSRRGYIPLSLIDLHQANTVFPSLRTLHSLVGVLCWRVGPHLCCDNTFRSSYLSCICLIQINGHTCGQKIPNGNVVFLLSQQTELSQSNTKYAVNVFSNWSRRNKIHKCLFCLLHHPF